MPSGRWIRSRASSPTASLLRDGSTRRVPAAEIVERDLVAAQSPDQVVADEELSIAVDLRLDESILTGESEPLPRAAGDQLRSAAFVVEDSGTYRADRYRRRHADHFGEPRSFRHPRFRPQSRTTRTTAEHQAVDRLLERRLGLLAVASPHAHA